jgi:peptidylprolyl isomerase
MTMLKNGDTIKVHYTGTLEDGRVFDTSKGRDPLEFTTGEGRIISGFENAIMGMTVGETRDFEVAPDEAYGFRHEQMVLEVPMGDFPEHIEPQLGMRLQLQQQEGNPVEVVITDISEKAITLDGNHPLAGQTLHFQVELLEITNPA